MNEFVANLANIAPRTSLFRSGASFFAIFMTLPLVYFEVIVFMHLAWKCIGVSVPLKKTLIPGLFQAMIVFFARQLIPVPFHILVTVIILIFNVLIIGRLTLSKAIIATSFTESVVIIGSIIFSEPLLLLTSKEYTTFLLSTPIGFCLGTLIESMLPLIILIVFIKYDFSLLALDHKRNAPVKNK